MSAQRPASQRSNYYETNILEEAAFLVAKDQEFLSDVSVSTNGRITVFVFANHNGLQEARHAYMTRCSLVEPNYLFACRRALLKFSRSGIWEKPSKTLVTNVPNRR